MSTDVPLDPVSALDELTDQVRDAVAQRRALRLRGGDTRRFYGEPYTHEPEQVLDLSRYRGIVSYEPSELVITARAGTPLAEIESVLADERQMLAFEPPRFGAGGTLGGCILTGLSGPRRMAAGSARDFVLGAHLLAGTGEVLRFGGDVMKNVAGYDVSRLLAGSLGVLGPVLQLSVKVAPRPLCEATVVIPVDEAGALEHCRRWRSLPLPISATCWVDGVLTVRLSGSEPAVASALQQVGGDRLDEAQAQAFWNSLRDQTHPYFSARPLWRLAVPPHTPALPLGASLIEWEGGQRWLATDMPAADIRARVAQVGGHATLYRWDTLPAGQTVFHPLAPVVAQVHQRLKQAFDPAEVFNPGRLLAASAAATGAEPTPASSSIL